MNSFNSTLEELAQSGEGRYLTTAELQPLVGYLKTFSQRVQTYNLLRDKGQKIVEVALKKFTPLNPELMQKHGSRCAYDMNEAMRYIALAILRDDEKFFKEGLFFWQANILSAYRQNSNCLVAYRCLKEVVEEHIPQQAQEYINPYIDMVLNTLDLPAKVPSNSEKMTARV